jgi:hypothetical protein
MTIIAGPLPTPTTPDKTITPAVDRRMRYAGLSPGLLAAGDGATTQNGTPDMRVLVAAISGCLVDDGLAFGAGKYWIESDAQVTVGPLAASDPGNPRIDLIVAKVQDTDAGDGSLTPQITYVTGVAAASPSVPATPARCEALYQVAVAAGATTIVNANLTDVRRFSAPVGALPKMAIKTSDTGTFGGTIGALTDPAGLSVTITADGVTPYRVIGNVRSYESGTLDDLIGVYIREGSTKLAGCFSPRIRITGTAEGGGMFSTKPFTPTAGTHTYKITVAKEAGTAGSNAKLNATTDENTWIAVERVFG